MPIKIQYESEADVPEAHKELYENKDGKFVLTGVEGLKTQADIDKLHSALGKERTEHKNTKSKYGFLEGIDLEEAQRRITTYEEIALAAEGKVDSKKIDEIVNARITGIKTPLENSLKQTGEKLTLAETRAAQLEQTLLRRDVNDAVRTSALTAKIAETAVEDVLLLAGTIFEKTEDGRIVTKDGIPNVNGGLDAAAWLNEMKEKRPHWWPASQNAGGLGGGGNQNSTNPWSKKGWNMTEQTRIVREKGPVAAESMAKAVGSTVGAIRPPEA